MRLALRHEPFNHPNWIWELKYDGFRALLRVAEGRADLISRRKNVYKSFGPLCTDLARALAGHEAVLDGEIVCLDAAGKPQFYDLLRRRGEPCFIAFDLLRLDGRDLRALPLIERKAALGRIVPSGSRLLYARHIEGDGTGLFDVVCREDLEGVVGKRKHGRYLDGRESNTTWVKVKNPNYSQAVGRDDLFARRVGEASEAVTGG